MKDSLWENLNRKDGFSFIDRLEEKNIEISGEQLRDLITLTLANWLEQRPRAPEEYLFVRQEEFLRSEKYLPKIAFEEFKKAYGL